MSLESDNSRNILEDRHGLSSHLVVGLKEELKYRGLTATGRKAVLCARFEEYMDGERPRSATVVAFLGESA